MKPIRECPLCGCKEVDKIYSLNFPNNKDISGLPNDYDIVICNNCQLVYDDFDIKTSLNQYINYSIQDINNIIKKLILSNEKFILWGIGSSTLPLFSLGLQNLNIVGIVDTSTKKQGKTLFGHKIISPNEIKDKDATILILPVVYQDSIYKQIKQIGLKNKIQSIAEQSMHNN